MKLGESLEVALSVKDLPTSLAFYKTLGFSQIGEPYAEPHPWVLLSDGSVHLGLHQARQPSPILMYFTNDIDEKVMWLERLDVPLANQLERDGSLVMVAFDDPNGQRIALVNRIGPQSVKPVREAGLPIGEFGEFSIPTADRDSSVAYYRGLGFEGQVYDEPYPWALMQDGLIAIGLHQTTDFKRSTITYFAKDMAERFRWVRSQGIEPYYSNKDENGIEYEGGILSPDRQPFFLFKW